MSHTNRNENAALASNLREVANLLEQQGEDGFRAGAYRRAADTVDALQRPVAEILASEGRAGLVALPTIGWGIASALDEMVTTGGWAQLRRLRGEAAPEKLFRTIPGIGPELAGELSEALGAETLETLEIAAHDGRLETVRGIGPRRAQMIRAALAERLGRGRLLRMRSSTPPPPAALLLDIDREYRQKAQDGSLPRIAPRRFNPRAEAWLPILHTRRGEWMFTALYSNTALAHRLARNRDWVVIYYSTGSLTEGRCTIVTETRGPLAGRRVVRGREAECQTLVAAA